MQYVCFPRTRSIYINCKPVPQSIFAPGCERCAALPFGALQLQQLLLCSPSIKCRALCRCCMGLASTANTFSRHCMPVPQPRCLCMCHMQLVICSSVEMLAGGCGIQWHWARGLSGKRSASLPCLPLLGRPPYRARGRHAQAHAQSSTASFVG